MLFIGFFNFPIFDLVPIACINPDANYYDSLVFSTLMPIAAAVCLMGANFYRGVKIDEKGNRTGTPAYLNACLLLTYLVISPVSTKIFYFFRCESFSEINTSYLTVDLRLGCSRDGMLTPHYAAMLTYNLVMVAIYPVGIPLLYSVQLFKARYELYPGLKDNDNWRQIFIHQRNWDDEDRNDQDEEAEAHRLDFLVAPYEKHVFWFEVFECIRRLLLSSMLVFFGPATSGQLVVAIIICHVAIKVYAYYAPFKEDNDDRLAEAAQWLLYCVLFSSLLLLAEFPNQTGDDDEKMGPILVLLSLAPTVYMFGLVINELHGLAAIGENDPKAGGFAQKLQAWKQRYNVASEKISSVRSSVGTFVAVKLGLSLARRGAATGDRRRSQMGDWFAEDMAGEQQGIEMNRNRASSSLPEYSNPMSSAPDSSDFKSADRVHIMNPMWKNSHSKERKGKDDL